MLVHHSTTERISYSLKIHLIVHISFPKTQRMSSFTFYLPLRLIHLIMRMPKNSLIFFYRGSHDPFSSIFYHEHESIVVDLSNPLVYDNLHDDEVETPKTVEALQPELMVMSSPRSLGVSLTSDHEVVQSPKAPHHSSVCNEDPSHTQTTLPPLELHDPIAHTLEETYIASTRS